MLFIFESVPVQTHLLRARETHVIGQNKNSLISFLSSLLQCFLVKNGFYFPKEPFSGPPPSPRKRKKLERYQFDDSGYAEPTSIGSLENEHHMLVPDSSETFYTSQVGPHIPRRSVFFSDCSIGYSFGGDCVD